MISFKRFKALPTYLFRKIKTHRNTKPLKIARRQLIASKSISIDEKKLLESVSLKVHYKDSMYKSHKSGAQHYLSVGLSANRCINEALRSVDRELSINSILDFPCGYGRVLRILRAKYPHADITGAEINSAALKFCRKSFSINTILSKKIFSEIDLPQTFDLIWCGSLFTHIDEQSASNLLTFFNKHLSEQGVCIFTTHGENSINLIRNKKYTYGLPEGAQHTLLNQYNKKGYGFANYGIEDGYGISVVSEQRINELASALGNWKQIMFLERRWDNHQDVYAFQKGS